ncbi:MAG: GerW family sporulation protein [Clostridia bacterium]|nr:sporulation protein YtfJ [Clostridiales bacterium]MBQ3232708.1 GerW family sporulation protein [Clostridia bacterium]MBQ6715905.1 GerW family sporulation protein [Clostridia bacterium]
MDKHPIEGLMASTMENIRDMVDVNTVVGEAVQTSDGSTVIPISKVSFGFVAGGAEYKSGGYRTEKENGALPFGGGSGAGVSVSPMGFLVINEGSVRMLSARCDQPAEKLVEMIPQLANDIKDVLNKKMEN